MGVNFTFEGAERLRAWVDPQWSQSGFTERFLGSVAAALREQRQSALSTIATEDGLVPLLTAWTDGVFTPAACLRMAPQLEALLRSFPDCFTPYDHDNGLRLAADMRVCGEEGLDLHFG